MDDKDSLFLTDIPKLSEENMNLCEGKVTRNECFEVLKEMKFNICGEKETRTKSNLHLDKSGRLFKAV